MRACLPLPLVVSLVGGLGLVAAFYMPWFSSQGLLLSGQFLHLFLSSASPSDLNRFLPATSPAEVQVLRTLVDLFPVCGAIAGGLSLVAGLAPRARRLATVLLVLSGVVPLLAWAGGVTRLPPGSNPEIGLSVIAAGSLGVLAGAAVQLALLRNPHNPIDRRGSW